MRTTAFQRAAADANHIKTGAGNLNKGSAAVRRDPSVLPLALIVGGAVGVALYFFSGKTREENVKTHPPERGFAPKGIRADPTPKPAIDTLLSVFRGD